MREDRLQFWLDYTLELARLMKLNDWHFELNDEPPGHGDALAEITCTDGRQRAVLQFGWDFEKKTTAEQRHIIVHELIHAHFDRAERVLTAVWEMQDNSYHHIVEIHRSQLEYSIDEIACVLAAHMPLPELETE